MSSVVRVDVTGGGNDFSKQVEVDTDRVVSSFKIDLKDREITVNYKRSDSDGEPLNVDEVEESVADETLLGVVAPVDERVQLEGESDIEIKEGEEDEGKSKRTESTRKRTSGSAGKADESKNSAIDPDGNTAKVKNDETKLDS